MSNGRRLKNSLKLIREQLKLTQQELADQSGLSRSEISAIEIGRIVPSTTASLALAQALQCSIEDIFSLSELKTSDGTETWAWDQPSTRYWSATLNEQVYHYPAETLPIGQMDTDEQSANYELMKKTLVIASCDPAAGILARMLDANGIRCLVFERTSKESLQLLENGLVHVAGLHLGHTPGVNASYIKENLKGNYTLIHQCLWEEGIAFSPAIKGLRMRSEVLRKLRWVGRKEGSGARQCSDMLLEKPKKPPIGYNVYASGHRAVADSIKAGWAEVGVCLRLTAEESRLNFQSYIKESFDLCFSESSSGDLRVMKLVEVLQSRAFKTALSKLPGYDTLTMGDTIRV